MRSVPILFLAATALLSASAHAATAEDFVSVDLAGSTFTFREQETHTGTDAQDLRKDIDDEGDGNGVVTSGEISSYNAGQVSRTTKDAPDCFKSFDFVRIDGKRPTRLSEVGESVAANAVGSVSSTSPITVTNRLVFVYPTAASGRHQVLVNYADWAAFGQSVGCYFSAAYSGYMGGGYYTPSPGCCGPPLATLPSAAFLPMGMSAQSSGSPDDATVLLVHPASGHSVERDSVQPAALRDLWDGRGLRADTDAERQQLMAGTASLTIHSGAATAPWEGTARNVGATVGYATLGAAILLGGLALATEFGRYHLLKWLILVPGFTRLEKDEVLEHSKRDELYRFIKQNPGPSFSDLRRELALSNGTLVHHLHILEAQEYVKPVRDGFRTRFYIRGPKVIVESYLTRTQQQLFDAIAANPGLTQKELAQVLGLPRESVSYHTKQLASKGRLEIKQDGKWRRYWPAARAAATP